MDKTRLTRQVLMALLLGSTFLGGTASAEVRTITTDQAGDVSLPGSGNTLIIESGTLSGKVRGGYTADGNVTGNTVLVTGGTLSDKLYGGYAENGNVTGNTVTIKGGTIAKVYGGFSGNGNVTGNTINIMGGTISERIYGGYPRGGNGYASGNVVNLYGGNLEDASIYGGMWPDNPGSSGNTLNVYAPLQVYGIYYFQNYNFYIPATLTGSSPLLRVSADGESDICHTAATVSFIGIAGNSAYQKGDTIRLLSGSIADGAGLTSNSVLVQKGFATAYASTLTLTTGTNGSLTVKLGEASLNPRVKALSEVQTATLANLNTGADLAAGSGLENAVLAAAGGNGQAVGFAGTSAGQETISTGSEVDGRGFGLMAGAAGQHRIAAGQLTTGVFAEAGWSSFTSTNEVSGAAVNADGHSNYEGGGILARLDRTNGSWYEGSLHVGHMDSAYGSADVTDYTGSATSYSVGSPYYSAHIGLGHVWQLGQKEQLDVYGKYLWSQLPARSVTVAGDAVDFAAVSSNRLRLGARWTKRCDEGSVYAGLAAEREFSGGQHANVAGWDVPAPSLSGTTGIVELGWRVPPTAGSPFGVDLSLAGLFGKRQGIAGGLSFSWGW